MNQNNYAGAEDSRSDMWIALVLALLTAAAFYPFASLRCDAHHDGIMLKPALDVLSGQVLFRDTFTQYGPLTTYLQALALAIEPTLLSIRLLAVVAQAGALALFYLAWRAILPRPVCLIAAAVFIAFPMFYMPLFVMLPWSSTLALFFQSMALLALVRLIGGAPSAMWGWLLGVGCACTFWCRQPVGAFLTIGVASCAFVLWWTGWNPSKDGWIRIGCRVLAGAVLVSVLILGHLAMNGALGNWWEQNVLWPRRWAAEVGENAFWIFMNNLFLWPISRIAPIVLAVTFAPSLIRRVWAGMPAWVEFVWWPFLCAAYWFGADRWVQLGLAQFQAGWSVLIILSAGLLIVWVGGRALWCRIAHRPVTVHFQLVTALALVTLASLPQIYPMTSANHVVWAVAPGIGVLIYGVYRLSGLNERTCALGLLLVFSVGIYEKYRWGLYTATQPFVRLESPAEMRGIRVDASLAAAFGRVDAMVSEILASDPRAEVIMYGDDALYLTWFKRRENPSPYYVTWPTLLKEDDVKRRWDYVVSHRPVVLLNGKSAADLKYLPTDYKLVLQEPELDLRIVLPGWLREKMDGRMKKEGG